MSVATEITRLQTIRNEIRDVLIRWGIITDATANFDACLAALESVAVNGTVDVTLDTDNTSIDVPAGLYDGGAIKINLQEKIATANGEVTPDSGNVLSKVTVNITPKVQSKSATPSKSSQVITPDSGYDGLSQVNVAAIPDAYQNVSDVTATASDVLANKIIVLADGTVVAGTMVNNGAVSATIDGLATTEYTIPIGFHSGNGKVSLTSDIEDALALL